MPLSKIDVAFFQRDVPVIKDRLKEEENHCVKCGAKCVGKSIGPHYKNSKICAEFKRNLEKRSDLQNERMPLEERLDEQRIETVVMPKI